MLYARSVELAKDIAIPTKKPFSQATNSRAGKAYGPELNNTANEIKRKKSYYSTQPAQDTTNSHPKSTKEKEWGHDKKKMGSENKQKNRRKVKIKQFD